MTRIAPSFRVYLLIVLITPALHVAAQTPSASPTPTPSTGSTRSENYLEKNFFKNILLDQKALWTSPFHLQASDAKWAVPFTASLATLFATDRRTAHELVENGENVRRVRISNHISQMGAIYTTTAVAATFYLTGRATHNSRARETGLLAAESLINGGIIGLALKEATQRERPAEDDQGGHFFVGGSSFPSGHSISAWSVATVIAEEYGQKRPVVRFGLYGLATAVSISRFTARKHFLSDVLVGSAIGYGVGRYTYKRHHDPALDSISQNSRSKVLQSKWFPLVAPEYNPRVHAYGASLAWTF